MLIYFRMCTVYIYLYTYCIHIHQQYVYSISSTWIPFFDHFSHEFLEHFHVSQNWLNRTPALQASLGGMRATSVRGLFEQDKTLKKPMKKSEEPNIIQKNPDPFQVWV